MSLNEQAVLDTRKLVTGKDGQLFVEVDGAMIFLAEVNQFTIGMNVSNTDYQPVGSPLVFGVNTGVSFNLSYTEAVIRDDITMYPIVKAIQNGETPNYVFQGVIKRSYDGEEARVVVRNCIPDGSFNIMEVAPAQIIQRQTTFRVNAFPEYQDYFTA